MVMVIFVMGICLGAMIVLVGLSVVVSVLTRRPTQDTQARPKQPYDDTIVYFHHESEQSLHAFLERLTHPSKKGNPS
jgi:hypothetical protein